MFDMTPSLYPADGRFRHDGFTQIFRVEAMTAAHKVLCRDSNVRSTRELLRYCSRPVGRDELQLKWLQLFRESGRHAGGVQICTVVSSGKTGKACVKGGAVTLRL
jgi:hypothetical protein